MKVLVQNFLQTIQETDITCYTDGSVIYPDKVQEDMVQENADPENDMDTFFNYAASGDILRITKITFS